MLPANAVSRAAARWLRILRTSTFIQAWSVIEADSSYTDLTKTQYASALDWLLALDLLVDGQYGLELATAAKALPQLELNQLFFERSLERAAPAWLPDSDLLIPDETELPQDAAALAQILDLSDQLALLAVRRAHGRVNLAERSAIGLAGERALVGILEDRWPGSTTHVSQTDDGFGYDIVFNHKKIEWHLEVKTTTRRGRLVVYLSRHEHEVGLSDPSWRLIVVGLDDRLQLRTVATAKFAEIAARAPQDRHNYAKWQSTSHHLTDRDVEGGLSFLGDQLLVADSPLGALKPTSSPASAHSPL
jgi:hypothetical protein